MKSYFLLILTALILVACETASVNITDLPYQTSTQPELMPTRLNATKPLVETTQVPNVITSATVSATLPVTSTIASTPTPAIQIDMSEFDPDVNPPITVLHMPPLIARSDETVNLGFSFICAYMLQAPDLECGLNATLYVCYGDGNDFTPVSLTAGYHSDSTVLSADLPASDENGLPLRYYIQVNDPQVGLDIRYPTAGAIDLLAVDDFMTVELPEQGSRDSGDILLDLPWGSGLEEVGLRSREGYPAKEGPLAMDVAEDGRIGLLDHVNERIIVFDPTVKTSTTFPLPFSLHSQGDIQFDQNGQVAVFDPVGKPVEESTVNIPQLHLFQPEEQPGVTAPVFVRIPAWLTSDLEVVDLSYSKLVVPINSSGTVNSREIQQKKQPAKLLGKVMPDTVYAAQLADVEKEIAFNIHSTSPLGAIIFFEKIPQGYLVVFEGDVFRAVWLDPSGKVLQDITLPRDDYTEIRSFGRFATDANGSLYILQSVSDGIEVRWIDAP